MTKEITVQDGIQTILRTYKNKKKYTIASNTGKSVFLTTLIVANHYIDSLGEENKLIGWYEVRIDNKPAVYNNALFPGDEGRHKFFPIPLKGKKIVIKASLNAEVKWSIYN